MAKNFSMVELRLIRDSLLRVTPARDQADALWDVIEKINALIGEQREQDKGKSANRNKRSAGN
jgi:hypothetical protein